MKKDMKRHMLKMLKSSMRDMMNEDKSESMGAMKRHESSESEEYEANEKPEKMTKVTVMGDSPESVEKGLSKAQEIMKAKLGEASLGSEELEKKSKKAKK